MKESILNDHILNTVNKWGAIYFEDLVSHLSRYDFNTKLSRLYVDRLTDKGLLEKISDIKNTRKKIILPKSMKEFYSSEEDVISNSVHRTHDSITTGICLDILGFGSVADINGARHTHDALSKKGDLVPDAELAIWNEQKTTIRQVALEVEIQQKNKMKIRNKFLSYSTNTSYANVLYFFPNERIALTYKIVLGQLRSESPDIKNRNFEKFIFLYRKDENLKLTRLDSYELCSPEKSDNYKAILTNY